MENLAPKNNPYVLPQTDENNIIHPDYNGMLLRDYFAAKALNGMLSSNDNRSNGTRREGDPKYWAIMAYEFADAMLKAREL